MELMVEKSQHQVVDFIVEVRETNRLLFFNNRYGHIQKVYFVLVDTFYIEFI